MSKKDKNHIRIFTTIKEMKMGASPTMKTVNAIVEDGIQKIDFEILLQDGVKLIGQCYDGDINWINDQTKRLRVVDIKGELCDMPEYSVIYVKTKEA